MTAARKAVTEWAVPYIGCSGWNYASWKERFYPAGLPTSEWLRYYSTVFNTVEVNNTFYRLPDAATFAAWREQTPDGFVVTIKASRFLTHMKRLRDPKDPLDRLFSRARVLGPRLGPVLYQLPGRFRLDLERLDRFLQALPRQVRTGRRQPAAELPVRHAIEFRDPSWYTPETFDLLERHGVALCLHDKLGSTIREPKVGPFTYVRFHGPSGAYFGSYERGVLETWAKNLRADLRAGRSVYAYFNNDPDAAATRDARALAAAMGR
jgi:uncharacterized protein YecE (DUF72 family)